MKMFAIVLLMVAGTLIPLGPELVRVKDSRLAAWSGPDDSNQRRPGVLKVEDAQSYFEERSLALGEKVAAIIPSSASDHDEKNIPIPEAGSSSSPVPEEVVRSAPDL